MDPRMVPYRLFNAFRFYAARPGPEQRWFPHKTALNDRLLCRVSGCKGDNLRSCKLNFALERKTRKDRGYSNTDKDLLWDIYKGDYIGGNKRHAG